MCFGHKVIVMDELREKYPEKFNDSGSMDYKWFEELHWLKERDRKARGVECQSKP